MGKLSVMYDVLNDLSLETILAPYTSEERALALRHMDCLASLDRQTVGQPGHQGDLLLCAMGYPALSFMVLLASQGRDVVLRSSGAFLQEVQDVLQAGLSDVVIPIALTKPGRPLSAHLKELTPPIDPQVPFLLRVISLRLADGSQEILVTTLRDAQHFPSSDFQELYHQRWGSELVCKRMKQLLRFNQLRSTHRTTVGATVRALLVAWALQEDLGAEIQALLQALTSSRPLVLSRWCMTGLGLETLRHLVQSTWSRARLRLRLLRLQRFLCSRPRRRVHQETEVRVWLQGRLSRPFLLKEDTA